ncbi:hypothetical protein GXP71_09500 [Cellulomonas sp. H30R-01]|uniref:hypothetical protein n=1 Tax=Cellulomonas sp. H30R-01 TaxID=2704467 RepID=UPI00138D9531|nr:hypothetical protein [Cellulomonas sp. H30R-01]QHT56288.1 hypothetical protein GXP71_09500 [Cellulomonas sp. H30R-01]
MRWEALFDDMEAQLAAARSAAVRLDVAELTRAERATVGLGDRLRAGRDTSVTVRTAHGEALEGALVDVAPEWLLLALGPVQRALVPTAAVVAVAGLTVHAAPAAATVERRLGLGHALRALARDRAVVRVRSRDMELVGRVDRVGADHLDLTESDRPTTRARTWAVPFANLEVVRSG